MSSNSENFSRRRFISTVAMAGASIPLYNLTGDEILSYQPALSGKIHIFSKPLQWLGFDDLAAVLAESGAEGIDLSVRPGGHVLPENVETDLPKAFEAARKNGLSIDMIVTGITEAEEKYTEQILKTASSLGIKFYRMGYINFNDSVGVWETLQQYKPKLRKLEEMNRKYSIHGAYQNHVGTRVGGPVWDLYELLKDLDPKFIGCQYDVRHAVAEGSSSWINGLKLIQPWIKCTAIKDFKWSQNNGKWNPESVPLGEGTVNFDEYFRIVKKANITGPMSIHLEYPPFERYTVQLSDADKRKLFITAMKKDIDKLKLFRTKYQI
jgi:L-ribulose-5-phosphate 3-epimerase